MATRGLMGLIDGRFTMVISPRGADDSLPRPGSGDGAARREHRFERYPPRILRKDAIVQMHIRRFYPDARTLPESADATEPSG